MDEDTADLLNHLVEELEYYIGSDEPGSHLDSGDAERYIADATQAVYDYECSKVNLVDNRPKPLIFKVRL